MRKSLTAFLIAALVLTVASCASITDKESKKTAEPAPARSGASAQSSGSYVEFEDVLIPRELDLDSKASFVFETPQFKTGILVYKGRVDYVSLANFFENNMIKDNWNMRSKIKYTRTIMVFEKPDRDCIINIVDETFNTIVEVMVAPRMDARPSATGGVRSGSVPLETDLPR
jgi:hypothetical protein